MNLKNRKIFRNLQFYYISSYMELLYWKLYYVVGHPVCLLLVLIFSYLSTESFIDPRSQDDSEIEGPVYGNWLLGEFYPSDSKCSEILTACKTVKIFGLFKFANGNNDFEAQTKTGIDYYRVINFLWLLSFILHSQFWLY